MPRRINVIPPRFGDLEHAPLRRTNLPVADVLERLAFPLSLALPGHSSCLWRDDQNGRREAVGLWTPDGSVARADVDGTVRQAGSQHLWDIVEQTHQESPDRAPAREDFGLTLTSESQRAWHGTPDGPGWDLPRITPDSSVFAAD